MQIDKDLNSEYAELYLDIKEHLTSEIEKYVEKVKEKYSDNITTIYKDLKIQNTTNLIEGGVFSHIKSMVSLYRRLSKSMKPTLRYVKVDEAVAKMF